MHSQERPQIFVNRPEPMIISPPRLTDEQLEQIRTVVRQELQIAHQESLSSADWEKLTNQQQQDVQTWRNRVSDLLAAILIVESEAFYKSHPELRLSWSFRSEPVLRKE